MVKKISRITREKHLDHMVRVVPFIVTGYAIQCYLLTNYLSAHSWSLILLGLALVSMILGFIHYDLHHRVNFTESGLDVQFLGGKYFLTYAEINRVELSHQDGSFGTVKIFTKNGKKRTYYFVDDPVLVKEQIDKEVKGDQKQDLAA